MMKDNVNTYSLYSPMPEHTLIEFIPGPSDTLTPCHRVVLKQLNTGEIRTVEISFCAILIGFRPDLHFLEPNTQQEDSKASESDVHNDGIYLTKDSQLLTSPYTLLSRRIAWLKNLCAKCKHLSICERNRKNNMAHRQPLNRPIHCNCANDLQSKQSNKNHDDNKNDNDSNNNNCDTNADTNPTIESKHEQLEKKNPNASVVVTEPKATAPHGLGEEPNKPVDCKTNPIAVDKYSNEVLNVPMKGLYAMGPLVGDNFIRFIPGGALAITSALWKQR